MEMARAREHGGNQGGSNPLAVPLHEAALRLIGEKDPGDAGYGERTGDAADQRQTNGLLSMPPAP
jgi:hypothetical protein